MEKRCFACMNPTDTPVCRHCGHNNAQTLAGPGQDQFLRPGTTLGDRYYIGIPIDRNGEGITYIAFDTSRRVRVRVREFFPGALCRRDKARSALVVNQGYEIQFKALMTDFVELSKGLLAIQAHSSLLQATELLPENGTVYVVYEDVVGVSLSKYLREKAGELSWEETENLFLPLLYTVKLLNGEGIVHRGISPDTILVTENHELKLKGVCTSAVRAINTEIKPELFAGYAAPEQYEKCSSHGEWTDVYAVCAVLYKTLTGKVPPRADLRNLEPLVPPKELSPAVPQTVSDAILRGMAPQRERRTQYVKDLIGDLYAAASEPPVGGARRILDEEEDEEPVREKPAPRPRRSTRKRRFRLPIWLVVVLVTLPLMLAIFFLASQLLLGPSPSAPIPSAVSPEGSSEVSSSAPAPSSEVSSPAPKVMVPNFVGQFYDDVVQSEVYQRMFTFGEKKEVWDDDPDVEVGTIIDQSLEANQSVAEHAEIVLTVSKGPQLVTIIPFSDGVGQLLPQDDYINYYKKRGVNVQVEYQEAPGIEDGLVVGTSPLVGAVLDREKTNDLTVYVSKSPAGGYPSSSGEPFNEIYGHNSSES